MMTEMTRYKQQTDVDDDTSSVGSARTEELPTGTTTVHYHMGSHWWRSRTGLEKALLVGWLLLLLVVTVLVAVLHLQTRSKVIHVLNPVGPPSSSSPCLTPECVMLSGSVLSSMDPTVDPCEDFYRYSCGGWISKNPIPEGKPMWGTLTKLSSDNQLIIKNALESTEEAASKTEEKARIFYRSCIDANKTIEKLGGKPVLDLIKEMGGWSIGGKWSPKGYSVQRDIINSKVSQGSGALFAWGVAEDDKESSKHVLEFDQGGLSLAARNFYLNETEKKVLDAYVDYIAKVGVLLGGTENDTQRMAKGIVDVETEIAVITTPDEERRDDEKLYHVMTINDLNGNASFMNWTTFIRAAFNRLQATERVIVYAPEFLRNLTTIISNITSTDEGKTKFHDYLVWQAIKNYISFLSRDFREAAKGLEKAQMGVEGTEEIWRECVVFTDAALGPAIGAMYVRKAFQGGSKDMAKEMIKRVRKTFRDSFRVLDWMDDQTRKAATEKASAIIEMIGYPDYILDPHQLDDKFSNLTIIENEFFKNNVRVNKYAIEENHSRLFKPVNKTRWDMSPSTVNAYYTPTRNEIVFPAGILQAPFFHEHNSKSLNYGAVGVVMGHELAHAFDDEGRKYDKDGNLHQWWQQKAIDSFNVRASCMEKQYSSYSLDGESINGKLTLGENIADNGGLTASFRAYQQWVKDNGEEPSLPGLNLNHQQLFFLGFAQVWCSSITKEAAHLEIMKDSHVPGEFRVMGTLSNSDEFSKAFNCSKGSRMSRKNKCRVW